MTPSPKLVRLRAILRQLTPVWDVAAGLCVLFDSDEVFVDDRMADDLLELLGQTLSSLDPLPETHKEEGLEYLKDWISAQGQTNLAFSV